MPGEFLGEGKPGGWRLKTVSWRSWDPSWTFKDGLVEREGGTNSIKPSQPADSHGKNKAKSRKAWRVGSVLWVFSKSRQELRFQRPLPASAPGQGAVGSPDSSASVKRPVVIEPRDQGRLERSKRLPGSLPPPHHLLAVKPGRVPPPTWPCFPAL